MNNEEPLGTSFRPMESREILLGEEGDESLQVGCVLSIFLYSSLFSFFFFGTVQGGEGLGATFSQRGVNPGHQSVVFFFS